MKDRDIKFLKVKSHVGVYNELADRLAAKATVEDKNSRNWLVIKVSFEIFKCINNNI